MNAYKFLRNGPITLLSYREPYIHLTPKKFYAPSCGVVRIFDPLMRINSGIWIATGITKADKEVINAKNEIKVPPQEPSYTLKRIWLDKSIETKNAIFINGVLWPLFHGFSFWRSRMSTIKELFDVYTSVNVAFAQAAANTSGKYIWCQDLYNILCPKLMRKKHQKRKFLYFWHVPWPHFSILRSFAYLKVLVDAMLYNDIIGFNSISAQRNFLETVKMLKLGKGRGSHIISNGRIIKTIASPSSIDYEKIRNTAKNVPIDLLEKFKAKLRIKDSDIVGLGVDRLDYTKGLEEKIRGIIYFLKKNPEFQNRFKFIQIAPESRLYLPEYRILKQKLSHLVHKANACFNKSRPIRLINKTLDLFELIVLYRLSNFILITSISDGLNLVTKEFIASNFDKRGVVILSKFTGVAEELGYDDLLLIDPNSQKSIAAGIRKACLMSPSEKARRMEILHKKIKKNNVYHWAAKILDS